MLSVSEEYLLEEGTSDREEFLPLLLEADPSESLVRQYLPQGRIFVLRKRSGNFPLLGVMIVTERGDGNPELKNLAVVFEERGKGHGRRLVGYACDLAREEERILYVGTSEQGVPFYSRCGFVFSHRAPGFFLLHYDEPVMENGSQCVDMIYLRFPGN